MVKNNKILLNWLPPASVVYPSPACSILKTFLQKNGYEVDVKYWNVNFKKMQDDILRIDISTIDDTSLTLLPFLSYIAHKSKDRESINKIVYRLLAKNPQWVNFSPDLITGKAAEYIKKVDDILNAELARLEIEKYSLIGVSSKLSQWIPANIIVEKIKSMYPNLPVVIGGFGSQEEAFAMMKNFSFYDYAIWGEGEYPLLELLSVLRSKDKQNVPYLIYRNDNKILVSSNKKKKYLDLNEFYPDFSDYFAQRELGTKSYVTIEGSRGCHWQRCRFCYLNDGYKYRKKNISITVKELKKCIANYNVHCFEFLDNDIIGEDFVEFNHLLDELIKIREKYNEFKIELAEIITKGINSETIKKMSFAGFKSVQIGYESPSNELLRKIHKKNSFASNLLFVKWALFYKIKVSGVNVLTGLIEETQDDVVEGINNLKFLRFYLLRHYFEHNISTLAVTCTSKYFKGMSEEEKRNWNRDPLFGYLPKEYVDYGDRFKMFQFISMDLINWELWDNFRSLESYYKNNSYEYEMVKLSDRIFYKEYFNKEIINEIEFDNPLYIKILSQSNHSVVSIENLCAQNNESEEIIKEIVDSLYDEGLLYKSYSYDEIVAIINVDLML